MGSIFTVPGKVSCFFKRYFSICIMGIVAVLFIQAGISPGYCSQKELVITHSSDMAPFSYINENAEPAGVIVEIWKKWAERTDRKIRFKLVRWDQTIRLMESGEADIHGGLYFTETRNKSIDFSKPFYSIKGAIFIRNGYDIHDPDDLGLLKVGVQRRSFAEHFIEEQFPDLKLVSFGGLEQLVLAASAGEIDCFVADLPSGMFLLTRLGLNENFRVMKTLYENGIHAGVQKGNAELASFIDKGMVKVGRQNMINILNRWIVSREVVPDWVLGFTIFGCMSLVISFLILHRLMMKRVVRKRTFELKKALRLREKALTEAREAHLKLQKHKEVLEKLSSTDELTGIFNRRYFDGYLEQHILEAVLKNSSIALIMLDVDGFKSFNDIYGHLEGDECLKKIASTISSCAKRPQDIAARYGGEEFCCVLPDTDVSGALVVAENIRKAVYSLNISHKQSVAEERITVSMGVHAEVPTPDMTKKEYINQADKLLYQAKNSGRNKVCSSMALQLKTPDSNETSPEIKRENVPASGF